MPSVTLIIQSNYCLFGLITALKDPDIYNNYLMVSMKNEKALYKGFWIDFYERYTMGNVAKVPL